LFLWCHNTTVLVAGLANDEWSNTQAEAQCTKPTSRSLVVSRFVGWNTPSSKWTPSGPSGSLFSQRSWCWLHFCVLPLPLHLLLVQKTATITTTWNASWWVLEFWQFCSPSLCFFAPIYKYGIVLVVASLVSILTAAARVRWMNGLCILVLVVAIFYMFDFVHGNFLLNFSSGRNVATGIVDSSTSGILHATRKMFTSHTDVQTQQYCTKYYNYFRFDPQIRDNDRFDNPEVTTFGYCSRAWVVALYLFEAAAMNLVIVQLFLALLTLTSRHHHIHQISHMDH